MRGNGKSVFSAFTAVLVGAIALSGCATTGSGDQVGRGTAMDRAIGECVASVAVGAALGAVIGGVAGGRNAAGRGAVIGGAIGVGRCAVLLQVAAADDRQRIRQAELAAVRANASQTQVISTRSGKTASISTRVGPAPVPTPRPVKSASAPTAPVYTNCRFADQTVTVDGQSAGAGRQLWCRAETGDWQAIDQ